MQKDEGVVVIDVDSVGGLNDVTDCSIGLDEYTASYEGAEKFCQDYLEKGTGLSSLPEIRAIQTVKTV